MAPYVYERRPAFQPSEQQQNYFDWLQNGSGSCLLEAAAGTGKSTTLVQGFRYMSGNIFCGAFNKAAANDLKAKAEEARVSGPFISTCHAAGFGAFRRVYKSVQVDDRKVKKLIDAFIVVNPLVGIPVRDCAGFMGKLVSFGKQYLIGVSGFPAIEDDAEWLRLIDHFSIDADLPDGVDTAQALEWTKEIYRQSQENCRKVIDFDDMIFAPLAYNVRFFPNDWIVLDECQDLNLARRVMAKRMLKAGGRAAFVGDRKQSIYAFTGAGGDSIDMLIKEFNIQTILPLTVTYRCPKTVVNYVKTEIDPSYAIEAHPSAPEGVVRGVNYVKERACECVSAAADQACTTCNGSKRIPAAPWFVQDGPEAQDVVLCRFTKPLVQTAYSMIKSGLACRVEGRNIGNGLVALATRWKIKTLVRLDDKLTAYLKREIEKAQASGSEKRQQEAEDLVATVRIFIERCREKGLTKIEDLVSEIQSLFADDVSGMITLCTGHRSKGREWPRVYWIQHNARRPGKPWEAEQEVNLKIVAGTRAKSEMILVPANIGE